MLTATNVVVHYGRRQILHEVSVEARPGEVTAIIGPNGSGKTTLMKALTGEMRFRGAASLNGLDVAKAHSWQLASMRGVLPQIATLAFPFTVHEVVRLGLTSGISITYQEQASLVGRALEMVDLPDFGPRFYQELSGGEQQRVQLARVLCQVWEPMLDGVPRFLFLDEPISSLDVKHQIQIMRIAADYAKAGGGVLAIMHDLNLTANFAHHIVLLSSGKVYASGPAKSVLTAENLEAVYDCPMHVTEQSDTGALAISPAIKLEMQH
ncbi:MAG: heme ABC transporter ATP-binding protein [Pseudomonadota bacterium]